MFYPRALAAVVCRNDEHPQTRRVSLDVLKCILAGATIHGANEYIRFRLDKPALKQPPNGIGRFIGNNYRHTGVESSPAWSTLTGIASRVAKSFGILDRAAPIC